MTYQEIQKEKIHLEQKIKKAQDEKGETKDLELSLMMLEEYEAKRISRGRGD